MNARAGIGLVVAAVGALGWVTIGGGSREIPRGSCPRVYAGGDDGVRLEATVLAGSMYPWAARTDVARMEHVAESGGAYAIRIEGEGIATEQIDKVALVVVDHAAEVEVVPTPEGELVGVQARGDDGTSLALPERGPHQTREARGREARGTEARGERGLTFERPGTRRAFVVVRARTTEFAEEAFGRYVARMGRGMGPFMSWVTGEDCSERCRREVMEDESERLGLRLHVSVGSGAETGETITVGPIGAAPRAIALPVELPPGDGVVTVRLAHTPRFWEIDEVTLSANPETKLEPRTLSARSAEVVSGTRAEDVTELVLAADRRRAALRSPDRLEVRFDAPPATPGQTRSVFVSVRGFYQVPIGGGPLIDPWAVAAHRAGWTSLPSYAARMP